MDVPYSGLVLFEYFSRFMKVAFWIFNVGFQKWFLSSTILIFRLSAVPVSLTDVTLICFFTCFYSFHCFFFFHLFTSSLLHRHSCTHSFHFRSTFFDFLLFICFVSLFLSSVFMLQPFSLLFLSFPPPTCSSFFCLEWMYFFQPCRGKKRVQIQLQDG